MPKQLKVRILDADGCNEEIATFEVSDENLETLLDYVRYAAELENNSLVLEGIPSSVTFNWNEKNGLSVEATIPPDERIDALLMKLRPFFLQSESTFFPKVRNILAQAGDNARVRQHLETLRYLFTGQRLQSVFVAGAASPSYPQGTIINSEGMLDLWLNGDRFHKEKDKRRIFDAMHGIMPPESSIALLLLLVADKVRAISGLRAIIEVLLGDRENVTAQVILAEPLHYHVFIHASLAQLDLLDAGDPPRSPPEPGDLFERVVDLTHLGPGTFIQLLHPIGQFWMAGGIEPTLGEHRVVFRVAKGFRGPGGTPSETPVDVIATFKVVAFLTEDPLTGARRKPLQTMQTRMHTDEANHAPSRLLRMIEAADELEQVLDQNPKPVVESVVVPRIAFRFAYWPISRQARERYQRIIAEGRVPTFEEVEGTDLSRAWEIFEESKTSDPEEGHD